MNILKRLTGWVLAVLLTLAAVSGMAEGADSRCDRAYQEVLDRYYALLTDDSADGSGEGEIGVWEARTCPGDTGSALDSVGYALEDMSGDGVPELLIGAITRRDGQLAYGSEIFALYACADGVPALTFEGWARSRHYTMGGGAFFYQGSGGAMFSLFGAYALAPDGSRLVCEDLYFTQEKTGTPEEIVLYHNRTGSMDPAESEELAIPEEQFWQLEAALESRVREIALTPFSQYAPALRENGSDIAVQARWAGGLPAGYDEYRASEEAQAGVLFAASSPVKDFRLLAIALMDADSDGRPVFRTEEVYCQDVLTPERPLVAYLDFFGDLPSNGISFVDEQGDTRCFAVAISGRDGSLQLIEFGH